MAYGDFTRLDRSLKSVFTAKDTDSFVANLSHARTIARDLHTTLGDKIYNALTSFAEKSDIAKGILSRARGEAKSLHEELSLGQKIALDLAGIRLDKPISDAALEASKLAANLNISLLAATNLRNAQKNDVYSGRGADPRKFMNGPTYSPITPVARGGVLQIDALQRTNDQLAIQNLALTTQASGLFISTEAARLYAEEMQKSGGNVGENTLALLRQTDALELRNKKLREGLNQTSNSNGLKTGVESSVRSGVMAAFNGGNVMQAVSNSMRNAFAGAISKRLIAGLGLEKLFSGASQAAAMQMASVTSAATIGQGMVTAGSVAAAQIGAAMAAGSAANAAGAAAGAAAGGGSWVTAAMSLFGFAEGGISTDQNSWAKVPSYAQGTANTGGIPAVLHPNEAVIPLSRGRKVPVDMTGGTGGGVGNISITTSVNVQGDSTTAEHGERIAKQVSEHIESIIDERIVNASMYGNALNLRGGI